MSYIDGHGNESDELRALPGARSGLGASSGRQPTPAELREVTRKNRAAVEAAIQKAGGAGLVGVNADGMFVLKNTFSQLDAVAVGVIKQNPAIRDAIRNSKLSSSLKTRLETAPASLAIEVFTPLMDVLEGICMATMDLGMSNAQKAAKTAVARMGPLAMGTGGYVYDLSGPPFFLGDKARAVNLANFDDPSMAVFEPGSRRMLKNLRIVQAFVTLFFLKPGELQLMAAQAGLQLVLPENETTLVSTTAAASDGTSPDKPRRVSKLPAGAQGPYGPNMLTPRAAEIAADQLVWVVPQDNRTGQKQTYVSLTSQGFADRRAALSADWDRKFVAYASDFSAWHPDFSARVAWLQSVERLPFQAAFDRVVREYDLPGRFARDNMPPKFQVSAGAALGGGTGTPQNGPKPVQGLRPLPAGSLAGLGGPDPATQLLEVETITALGGIPIEACIAILVATVTLVIGSALVTVLGFWVNNLHAEEMKRMDVESAERLETERIKATTTTQSASGQQVNVRDRKPVEDTRGEKPASDNTTLFVVAALAAAGVAFAVSKRK